MMQQDLSKVEDFWRETLNGFTVPTPLVVDGIYDSTPDQEVVYGIQEIRLSQETSLALTSLTQQGQLTLDVIIQGAWALLLSRYSSEEEVLLGTTITCPESIVDGLKEIGTSSLNIVPIRVHVSPEMSVLPWLKELQTRYNALQEYGCTPLIKIQEWSAISENAPLFESVVAFEDGSLSFPHIQDGNWNNQDFRLLEKTNCPIAVKGYSDYEFGLKITYDRRRFDEATITRMLGHLKTLLTDIAAKSEKLLSTLTLLTETEQHQLLMEWNDTQRDYPKNLCIHELFEAQVERTPHAVAVVFEEQQLTYRELNARANQLAHHLANQGVGSETLVGICVERSIEMLVGLLGTLKAGGAYVPLDPKSPPERLSFMLEDTQAVVLLTQQKLTEVLPPYRAQVVCLDTDWEIIVRESAENIGTKVSPENLVYVMYTSGSTGQPKGVAIEHRNLSNYLYWVNENLFSENVQNLPAITSLTFDASLKQLFAPILRGDRVWLLAEDKIIQPQALLQPFDGQAKVGLNCVPSLWTVILNEINSGQARLPVENLTTLFLGGEQFDEKLAERSIAALPHLQIWNLYGPTEATSNASAAKLVAGDKVTIGRPIANTQLYILDRHLQPVPIGVPGELYIGGDGLARGYLNRPELTSETFIQNPFSDQLKARLYRTGDMARYLPDGKIEFLGRIDHQVKIRGLRIELGEIESILKQHPNLQDAIVLAREDNLGDKHLVAYVVPYQTSTPTHKEIRTFLKQKLPNYMVPFTFVFLDGLPLTSSGKIDRRALPAPDTYGSELDTGYVAPQTELEYLLADLWREILGVEKTGIYDNFFALGGDSLKAAVLVNKLQATLGEYIYVVALFEAPTIFDFVGYLNKHYPDAVSRVFDGVSTQVPESDRNKVSPDQLEKIGQAKIAEFRQLITLLPHPEKSDEATISKNPPAIFVLSPPRSGSTLLRVMLAGHPHLFAPPELNLLSFSTLEQRRETLSGSDSFRLTGVIRAIMEAKACDVEQAQVMMKAYEKQKITAQRFYGLMQEWINPKILVDKSTTYAFNLEILKQAEVDFDNALYIHLLRHPFGMMNSFEKVRLERIFFKNQETFSAREMAELTWLICHQNILDFLQNIPTHRQHWVKFEDLVRQPQSVMNKICQFLGLELHPDMLQPYKHKEMKMTDGIYSGSASRMLGDVKFHEHKDIDPKVADRWKGYYPDDFLGDITWQVAESLGYERDSMIHQGFEENSVLPTRMGLEPIQSIRPGRDHQKDAEQLLARLDQLTDQEIDTLLGDMLNDGELR